MNNRQLVNHIAKRLRAKGIDVYVYSAVTTSSFYLRFDHGVLKQARVGDHRGKGYQYTYEIGKHIKVTQELQRKYLGSTYTRYLYPDTAVEDLIIQVLIMRSNMRAKYGKERYDAYVAEAAKADITR